MNYLVARITNSFPRRSVPSKLRGGVQLEADLFLGTGLFAVHKTGHIKDTRKINFIRRGIIYRDIYGS